MILCSSSSKLFTAALQRKRMKSKLKKMHQHQQCKDWIHYDTYILLNIMQLWKKWVRDVYLFSHVPNSPFFFFVTILSCFLCWLFSASKGRLYCSFVYIFSHISSKRTVPRMEIHLLDSYSVWHEIAAWDIVEEAGGWNLRESVQKSINSSME